MSSVHYSLYGAASRELSLPYPVSAFEWIIARQTHPKYEREYSDISPRESNAAGRG